MKIYTGHVTQSDAVEKRWESGKCGVENGFTVGGDGEKKVICLKQSCLAE
jgi:hypothetical protein